MIMTKAKKKRRGRPKGSTAEITASEKLPMVRVTLDQLENYKEAAQLEEIAFSAWVRGVLDKAANRILK